MIMINIFVFSQNLKLESLAKYSKLSSTNDKVIFLTTHHLFENEIEFLSNIYHNPIFHCFADFLTDDEMEKCDNEAFVSNKKDYNKYILNIKKMKNKIVLKKILEKYDVSNKYILSDDLGIDLNTWTKNGFIKIIGDYYYVRKKDNSIKTILSNITILKKMYHCFVRKNIVKKDEVFVSYFDNKKVVFLGKMDRIGYRLNISFQNSYDEWKKICLGKYDTKDNCIYMTTWHERSKCNVPDNIKYDVRWAQDGYLPPNYSHKDYYFKPKNVKYYCWDEIGTHLFINQNLPYEVIPFRKKILLPNAKFSKKISNVLIVASGSGDWTALKNRSDDDILVDAFVYIAKKYPKINFTYRCHPTWINPSNVGINSINRVKEYFDYLNLPNLHLSTNLPKQDLNDLKLSFPRKSLESDLKTADLVFGEHSISMIDAAFEEIPFSSVNITKRRNFFIDINNFGFPSCSSYNDIEKVIDNYNNESFQKLYQDSVNNYNKMVNI